MQRVYVLNTGFRDGLEVFSSMNRVEERILGKVRSLNSNSVGVFEVQGIIPDMNYRDTYKYRYVVEIQGGMKFVSIESNFGFSGNKEFNEVIPAGIFEGEWDDIGYQLEQIRGSMGGRIYYNDPGILRGLLGTEFEREVKEVPDILKPYYKHCYLLWKGKNKPE
jgi:hypothetical protein